MPILRDEGYEGYLREEGDGLMFGPYERTEQLKLFAENGVPEWFGADLLDEDFDAVSWNWERATELVPALGRAGIKRKCARTFQMTADELPLMARPGAWRISGSPKACRAASFGWRAIGYYLSERIVEGATASTRRNWIPGGSATTPTRT